jgi:hypothetical protein
MMEALPAGEVVARSAERRMSDAMEELRRMAFGDEAYLREVAAERARDAYAARWEEPPSQPSVLPGYKRRNWARRLLGR